MSNSTLEKSILLTVIYYNVLNKPLTAFEIWRYLLKPKSLRSAPLKNSELNFTLANVLKTLNNSEYLKDKVAQKNGYYFLSKKNKKHQAKRIFDDAIKTQKICAQKIKKARRYAAILKYLPFIRAIFLSGSVIMGNATKQSDLDVLVIAQKDKIWLVRALLVFTTLILGIKRSSSKTQDRICLNHYIATNHLTIPFMSIFTAQLYARLLPLYDEDNYFKKFYLKNSWLKNYLLNYNLFLNDNNFNNNMPFIKKILELKFNFLNLIFGALIKKIQIWHIKKKLFPLKSGGRVTFNDLMLEFHPTSKERAIIKAYNKLIRQYGFTAEELEEDSGLK